MSKLEVDAIEPQSGTTLTLGASGDTVTVASGATITDFTSTGIDDNATSTAITITSGNDVCIGSTNSGVGGVIDLSIGNTSSAGGITLWSPTNVAHSIGFGDGYTGTDRYRGYLEYDHVGDSMRFATSATERMRIDSSGLVGIGTTAPAAKLHVKNGDIRNEGTGTYYNLAAQVILTTGTPTADIDISSIATASTRDQSETYEMSVTESTGTAANLSRLFYVRFQEGTGYDITSAIYSLGSVTGAVTFSRPSSGIWRVASTASLNVATLRFRRLS